MGELLIGGYEKHLLLQWLIIALGAGLSFLIMVQVRKIFSGIEKEMWENNHPSPRSTRENPG
jgi:hypothetical protein